MAKQSRKHAEALAKVDRSRFYSPDEAIVLAKETSYVKFDATVEAHVRLDRKSTRLNSSHMSESRMPSSA